MSTEATAPATAIDDADDLRGFHFQRLLRKRLIWILGGGVALLVGVAAAIAAAPALGAALAVGALLLTVVVVFFLASAASERAFFQGYSKRRGLSLTEDGNLPGATPLLRKGDEREAHQIMSGSLADGLDGTLALYTYTDVYHDKNGRHETDYNFTVAMAEVAECAPFVPELFCQRKFGFQALEKLEDAFRSKERVELESVALDDRFEIFANKDQDANWLRQFFSPSFIVWLSEKAPEKFAFELVEGVLVCNVKGHKKSAAELDRMREATAVVVRRLREEAGE
jgi:hypothetical protein